MTESDRKVYADHAEEASKPIGQRAAVVEGRGGVVLPPRRHHLTGEKLDEFMVSSQAAGRFVSPYTDFGAYDGVVEALSRLGENEAHLLGTVLGEFERYMSEDESRNKRGRTAWESFRDRRPRSKKSGLDYTGRFQQNVHVLQRLGGDHPYGLKLAQLGACIDVLKGDKGEQLIQLRTKIPIGSEVKPVNGFKTRQCPRSRESYPSGVTFRSGTDKG